jgi:hypothetical protein
LVSALGGESDNSSANANLEPEPTTPNEARLNPNRTTNEFFRIPNLALEFDSPLSNHRATRSSRDNPEVFERCVNLHHTPV